MTKAVKTVKQTNGAATRTAKTSTIKSPKLHRVYWWSGPDGESELLRDASGQFYLKAIGSAERKPCTIAEGLLWYAGQEARDVMMDGWGGDNGLGIGELLTEAAKELTAPFVENPFQLTAEKLAVIRDMSLEGQIKLKADFLNFASQVDQVIAGVAR